MNPDSAFRLLPPALPRAWLRIAVANALGFPEFESIHLADFSAKAQFSKSAASTIPPRPQVGCQASDQIARQMHWPFIPSPNGPTAQLVELIFDSLIDADSSGERYDIEAILAGSVPCIFPSDLIYAF